MHKSFLFHVWVFLIVLQPLYAQFTPLNYHQSPSSVRWRVLENEAVRVIYPGYLRSQAQRIADVTSHMQKVMYGAAFSESKLPVILHGLTAQANGFAGLPPIKTEFFGAAPPTSRFLSGDWLDLLSIHEYRHLQQYQLNKSKLFYFIGGQLGWAGSTFLTLPDWYFEGDAVIAETELSEFGRGRLPAFSQDLRAMANADLVLDYELTRYFSYKFNVPSHYEYGYHMMGYLRKLSNQRTIDGVVKDAKYSSKPFPYLFSNRLKKTFDMKSPVLYSGTMRDFAYYVNESTVRSDLYTSLVGKPKVSDPTYYARPVWKDETSMIAIKYSYDETDYFVDVRGKEESKLFRTGLTRERYFNHDQDIVVWSEQRRHPRYSYKNYNVIMVADLTNNKTRQLTRRTKYFSPDINKSNDVIAAVELNDSLQYHMVLLNAQTGDQRQVFPNKENDHLMFPIFNTTGQKIYLIHRRKGRHAIFEYDVDKPAVGRMILPFQNVYINHPQELDGRIYFSSNYQPIEQIYCLNIETGRIEQVTKSLNGASQPAISASGNVLAFVEVHNNWHGISYTEMDVDGKEINRMVSLDFYAMDSLENTLNTFLDDIPSSKTVESKLKYKDKGLRLHSWYPLLTQNNLSDNEVIGLGLEAANNMTTVQSHLHMGVTNSFGRLLDFEIAYSRWIPVFTVGYNFQDENFTDFALDYERDVNLNLACFLPFTWTARDWIFSGLVWNSWQGSEYAQGTSASAPTFKRRLSQYVGRLQFTTRKTRALRHLQPRWGMRIELEYQRLLNQEIDHVGLLSTTDFRLDKMEGLMNLYLPGLNKSHSLYNQTYAFQGDILRQVNFDMPRGINMDYTTGNIWNGMKRVNNIQVVGNSLNYTFPLSYPDYSIRGFVLVNRIAANVFYDAIWWRQSDFSTYSFYDAYGVDFTFEANIFRLMPVQFGPTFIWNGLEDGVSLDLNLGVRF